MILKTIWPSNYTNHLVSGSLPLDDATKVAVRISEEAITPLGAKEQTMFMRDFKSIKWLNVVFSNDR